MTPRDYQTRAISGCRRHVASGKRAPLIVAPTGSGKTTMASLIVASHVAKGGRAVWFAHRVELIRQAVDTLRRLDLDVGAEGLNKRAPVQVLGVQASLIRGQAPEASLAIFDEAHHFAADEWKRLALAYDKSILIGLSATPERADGRGLDIFDSIVVAAQISELTKLGHLVPCEVLRPKRAIGKNTIAMSPVDAWLQHGAGRPMVVFAPHVKAANDFASQFAERGVAHHVVHGEMESYDRKCALDNFASGRVPVLINVYVLTEGWDCPRAAVCCIARKVGSASMYLQMVGRVLRPFAGKDRALLIDLTGAVDLYGPPDEDRIFSLGEKGISRESVQSADRYCRVCGELILEDGPCPSCGTESVQITPEAAGVALEKFAYMRALPANKRVVSFARWILAGWDKGHKDGAAKYKFKAVFGHFPDVSMVEGAVRLARQLRDERKGAA